MLNRLQSDNLRLSQEQKLKDKSSDIFFSDSSCYEDGMIQKLKEQVDRQRNDMKQKDRDIQEKTERMDQYLVEIEQFKNQNHESKKRFKLLQSQVKTLCEERADFLAKIQDQHREMISLKKQLGIAEKENEDFGKEDSTTPRFTIAELKEVLNERNDLKNRVNDLEEELLSCRPKSDSCELLPEQKVEAENEEDAPVQGKTILILHFFLQINKLLNIQKGPLPEEWYLLDDPWKRKNSESGIRKL